MPIYEYVCPSCERDFELLVRGGEDPACPACGTRKVERRLSVPAAHTGSRSASLPVCQADSPRPCGPGFCRTGQCGLD